MCSMYSVTCAVGLPDISAEVICRQSFIRLLDRGAALLLRKTRRHFRNDCSVFYRYLQMHKQDEIIHSKGVYRLFAVNLMYLNSPVLPAPSSFVRPPVDAAVFWRGRLGIRLDSE